MSKAKSWKTSLMGVIGILVLSICILLIYLGKCTLTELASFLSPLALFIGSIVAFLTKDSDVTGGTRKG